MTQVMYIAINKDLEGLMKEPGKISAHTAHAVFDYLLESMLKVNKEDKTCLLASYLEGPQDFKLFGDTIIVVKASEKQMLKWEQQGYTTVRDRGLTCVEENSLTAINLGVYNKDKEIPKFIQRLRLLKREDCI